MLSHMHYARCMRRKQRPGVPGGRHMYSTGSHQVDPGVQLMSFPPPLASLQGSGPSSFLAEGLREFTIYLQACNSIQH
jgi:hypothetical protein